MKRSVLDQYSSQISPTLIQRRLYDGSGSELLRIGLEFEKVCFEKHLFEQLVYIDTALRSYLLALVLTAPVLHENVHLGKLTTNGVGVSARLIYLIDGKYHRHACCLRVVNGLHGLRHHGIVGCDYDDGQVGHLRTAGTHRRKRLVSRGIEECDSTTVVERDVIGTDVLGDTTGLTGDYIGLTDVVEKRSLTVVYVTHHGYDRRTLHEILFLILLYCRINLLGNPGRYELDLIAELFCHQHERLGIESLVYGNHKSQAHTSSDDLYHRSIVHKGREVIHSHELGYLEDLILCCQLLHLLLGLRSCGVAFFLTILGTEVILLALVHLSVSLLNLLLNLLLHLLLLSFGKHRAEIRVIVITLLVLILLTGTLLCSGVLLRLIVRLSVIIRGVLSGLCEVDLLL